MDRDRSFPGGVAQLVERHVRNVEVGGSSPLTSTEELPGQRVFAALLKHRHHGSGARRAREMTAY